MSWFSRSYQRFPFFIRWEVFDSTKSHLGKLLLPIIRADRAAISKDTEIHVYWPLFRDESLENEFLDAFPRYQFEKRIERLFDAKDNC
jgi:hypothetical protein